MTGPSAACVSEAARVAIMPMNSTGIGCLLGRGSLRTRWILGVLTFKTAPGGADDRGMAVAERRERLPLVRAAAQLGSVVLFAALPLALVPLLLHAAGSDYLWDFRKEYLPAGRALLDGNSPYPHALSQLRSHANYVYPPLVAVFVAPLTWLPQMLAEWIFVALSLAAPALALRLLGVRDWRCYGIIYLWPPLLGGLSLGTISPLLALAVAAAWRWRRSSPALGAIVLGATVAKLFLWPLLSLFAIGDRWRAALVSIGAALVAVLASWALIGFAGLADYPRLLQELSRIESPRGSRPGARVASRGRSGARARRRPAVARRRHRPGPPPAQRGERAVLRDRRLAGALARRLAALPRTAARADRCGARPPRARLVRAAAVLDHAGHRQQWQHMAHRLGAHVHDPHARARCAARARSASSALTPSQATCPAVSGS